MLGDTGSAQADGEDRLDVWYEHWRAGDLSAQMQEVTLNADATPGECQVEIGWPNPETMQRLLVLWGGAATVDRLLLKPVQAR